MPRPIESHHTVATCIAVLRANGPMTAPDLAEVVGMKRTSSDWIRALLRRHPEISSRRRSIRNVRNEDEYSMRAEYFIKAEYFAFGAFPAEPPRNPDLWRGWRNPVTGHQPARLGLDSMPITGVEL